MIYTHRDLVFEELADFLNKNKVSNVLEVGAGDETNVVADTSEKLFKFYNIDYNACDLFGNNKNIKTVDAHELSKSYPEKSFDLIYLCHTFEHLENPIKAIKEMHKVLKDGGYLFIATPNPCEHHIILNDSDHIFVLEPMQMIKLLRYCGFEVKSYKQMLYKGKQIPYERDYNVITIGRKI